MPQQWRITRLRDGLALTFEQDGKRRRFTLGTADPGEARQIAPALFAELTRPAGRTVTDLWKGYETEKDGRAVLETMKHTWKAIGPHFGARDGESITLEDCRAYTADRRRKGRSDGSIHTELGHLRTVLKWAEKRRLIARAPDVDRPVKPAPKDRYLTKDEARKILAAASLPHVRIAIHLMLATAARISAILDLKWERVDFKRRLISLVDPEDKTPRKGRATVPINDTLLAALAVARKEALSDYVVEWGGKKVSSIKRSIEKAATKAKLDDVSPHVFRHTAAVWMAEGGTPLPEIAQYLGHSTPAITYRVYAKYSPDHLRSAAKTLEIDLYEVPAVTAEPQKKNEE